MAGKIVSLFQLAGSSPRRVKSSKMAAKLSSENFESAKKVKVYDSFSTRFNPLTPRTLFVP